VHDLSVHLRAVSPDDLPHFFAHQQDPVARHQAAFVSGDPTDWQTFLMRWEKMLADETVVIRTILCENRVIGYIASFLQFGKLSVCYWLDRDWWGQGLATAALRNFVHEVKTRPLYARVVKDNHASLRVLTRCGFIVCGEDRGFASARGSEVEEFILELSAV